MPLRIGNYGDWSGDRRDPKRRPGYGYHPPACTCYECVEGKQQAEAKRIVDAADAALRRPAPESETPSSNQLSPRKVPDGQSRHDRGAGDRSAVMVLVLVVIMAIGGFALAIGSSQGGDQVESSPPVASPPGVGGLVEIVPPTLVRVPVIPADPTYTPRPTPDFSYLARIEDWIVVYTNDFRKSEGLRPLAHSTRISAVARGHSENMAAQGRLSHQLSGLDPTGRGLAAGYRCKARVRGGTITALGENIIRFPTHERGDIWARKFAREIVDSWIGSPGHRKNLLNVNYRSIGVGVASDHSVSGSLGGWEDFYATQNFSPCS